MTTTMLWMGKPVAVVHEFEYDPEWARHWRASGRIVRRRFKTVRRHLP